MDNILCEHNYGQMMLDMGSIVGKRPIKITNHVRLIELFAGIGSQAKALENLGVDFERWFVCEFDKYAMESYNSIHGTLFKTSDVTQITADDLRITQTDKYTYILTYSFPCQDISTAGKMRGFAKGSGTRSGLLWEVERLLNECNELPQILLMENVNALVSSKNMPLFQEWIDTLSAMGYTSVWQVMNAKDYGIPQNRNRVFMVSWLGDGDYKFPSPFKLKTCLDDVIEDDVQEKYYLSDEKVDEESWETIRSYE